jgi:hypothetical protein
MSPRIGLVVTGGCEAKGLAPSLAGVFPGLATFEVAHQKQSLTSTDIEARDTQGTRSLADEFAAALVAEAVDGVYSFVVGVDDLELANAAQPELVVRQVVEAVARHVERRYPILRDRNHALDRVQERCSFHLLAPMVESYFFAEPTALAACGAKRPSLFQADQIDVERFEVSDPVYEAVPYPADAPREARKRSWALLAERNRHPKAYLKFLCQPDDPLCSNRAYRESREGAKALGALAWSPALTNPIHAALARSLFDDIAAMLGADLPFPGDSHRATSRPPAMRVLRNA